MYLFVGLLTGLCKKLQVDLVVIFSEV